MKDDLSEFVYFAAAAEKLQLQFTARMARTALKYCIYAYNCLLDKTPTVYPVLNGQDVAEDTLTLVQDICLTTDMLLKVEQMEASRREEEGDTLGEDGEGEEGEDAKEEQNEKKKVKKKERRTKKRKMKRKVKERKTRMRMRKVKQVWRKTKRMTTMETNKREIRGVTTLTANDGPKRLPWLCRATSEAPSTKRTLPKRSHH